jgi:hypothetical protein
MKSALSVMIVVAAFVAMPAAAQKEQTWRGAISDSNCNGKHAAEHDGKKLTDAECTTMCIKQGAKYVFVADGKVYQISNVNQHSKTLAAHAGEQVDMTGTLEGNTITARTITVAKK